MSKALPTSEQVIGMLRGVIDPELGTDIVELGMAKDAEVSADGVVTVTVALTTSGCPLRSQIQKDVRARVGSLPGVTKVKINWSELNQEEKAAAMERARFNVSQRREETAIGPFTKVVLVASGKGGVGKSSVTVNLAAALAAEGRKVGVLDADIWGFSVPRMLGVDGRIGGEVVGDKKWMLPHERQVGEGVIRIISMGFLVEDEETALMWRGLMLNRGVQHFLQDVRWGEDLDYLFVDMPPGTGDVQMGVAKMVPRAEVIVVTTPALAAQKVAVRVADMARKNFLRIAGVIENMSSFTCDHGTTYSLFGEGGGATLAKDAGVPLLGSIPLEPSVGAGGDQGQPIALGEGAAAEEFRRIARVLVDEAVPPAEMAGCTAHVLEALDNAVSEKSVDESPAETVVQLG